MNMKIFPVLVFILFLSACGSSSKNTSSAPTIGSGESGVKIKYFLAQTLYSLEVCEKGDQAVALSKVYDKAIVRTIINPAQYSAFVSRASLIAQEISRTENANDLKDCKTPYTLTLKKDGAITRKVSGCRTDDPDGKIGRLIQEGEFLFYSSKAKPQL